MTEIKYQVYDFASSARVERPLWLAFHHWMQRFAELFVEHWSNFSANEIQATPRSIDAHEFSWFQSRWDQPAYGVEVSFNNEQISGMLVFERLDLLKLLMDILGNSDDELVDRELTSIETSLGALIFEQTATTIADGWPEQESLTFKIGELFQQPNRSRLFASDMVLLASGLTVQLSESSAELQVLLTKEDTSRLLKIEDVVENRVDPNRRISEERISEIEVQISAGLGSAELPMNDLVSLSVGDVIMLDQRVTDPVVLFANQEPIFRAWPGRVANKLALKIVSTIN